MRRCWSVAGGVHYPNVGQIGEMGAEKAEKGAYKLNGGSAANEY